MILFGLASIGNAIAGETEARLAGCRVVVVCPLGWERELAEWEQLRIDQGAVVTRVASDRSPAVVRRRVAASLRRAPPVMGDSVVVWLLGDGEHAGPPAGLIAAEAVHRFGPERWIATDSVYADATPHPTVVARLPLPTRVATRAFIDRVVTRERSYERATGTPLTIVADRGGFGPWIDAAITLAARRIVDGLAPPDCDVRLVRLGQPSIAAADQIVADRAEASPTAWRASTSEPRGGVGVYLGHGLRELVPNASGDQLVAAFAGADVATLLACYTGDFTHPRACLASQLLTHPRGPLAVVAATRVSMPYGNARLGGELLRGLGRAGNRTAAGLLVGRSLQASLGPSSDESLAALDGLATAMQDPTPLDAQRRDHARMYHLLGDPLAAVGGATPEYLFASEVERLDPEPRVKRVAERTSKAPKRSRR